MDFSADGFLQIVRILAWLWIGAMFSLITVYWFKPNSRVAQFGLTTLFLPIGRAIDRFGQLIDRVMYPPAP